MVKIGHVVPFTKRMIRSFVAFHNLEKDVVDKEGITQIFLVPIGEYWKKWFPTRNGYQHYPIELQDEACYLKAIRELGLDAIVITEEFLMKSELITIPRYYIQHGFVTRHCLDKQYKSGWPADSCRLFFGIGSRFNFITDKFGIPREKVVNLQGLPQIDYLKSQIVTIEEGNQNKKIKNILFVFGSTPTYPNIKRDFSIFYNDFLKEFINQHPDIHWWVKTKKDHFSRAYGAFWQSTKWHTTFPNFSVLGPDEVLYDYLIKADLVIVQEGGSAFLESLMVNPKTLLLQLTPRCQNNYMEHDKFNLLHCAKTIDELKTWIDMWIDSEGNVKLDKPDVEYLKQIDEFIEMHVGGKVKMVCNDILSIIQKDILY